ncbi:Protein of unknown function [Streptacidiphilus jiangxiensis]|uniref:DUF3093 domain-containing protein n=2 Tax=Streptacidiphilus jiangxiensis TaxID=235985 RepID=A0A1H7KTR9_STRJI|nr:DUF3093 domain-containing protein [Streptacidiphilus jiangxiensis]SEK90162.1 Protein of unknown function [Streptacidiphilus jiangxiensis]
MDAMYDERLSAPAVLWLLPVGCGISFMLVLLVFSPIAALLGLVAGGVGGAVLLSSYGSPRIRVTQGHLLAGEAKIPVTALGEAEPLDREAAFAWRTTKADARAFMLMRGYIPTALRVVVTDPEDPTPYLYLSTRTPDRLAAALEAARQDAATASK